MYVKSYKAQQETFVVNYSLSIMFQHASMHFAGIAVRMLSRVFVLFEKMFPQLHEILHGCDNFHVLNVIPL